MDNLVVVPWRRYGRQRLYVNTTGGERVGWYDLTDGRAVLEQIAYQSAFEQVLADRGISAPITIKVATRRPAAFPGATSVPAGREAAAEAPWREDPPQRPAELSAQHPTAPIPVPEIALSDLLPLVPPTPPPPVAPGALATPIGSPRRPDDAGRPWVDLAGNRPGRGVYEEAAALRRAAPVHSRIARIVGVHTEERAFRIGGDGERKVAGRLAGLPEAWRVLHSVPIGSRGSDIDHVVVGPAGVFTVNTKHHPGARIWVKGNTILVNGTSVPYVRNSRFEAERASSMLTRATGIPLRAVGVIAVVGAHGGMTVNAQPADGTVSVVGRKQLVKWLLNHGVILSSEQVITIFEHARRSTTWA